MTGYTVRDVAGLLNLTEQRVRAYVRAGVLQPARGARNEYLFTFQDLVLLRTAVELTAANVPLRRVGEALTKLRDALPHGRSLTALRIHASGDEVVVRESSEPPWNPQSGQFHIEFDVRDLAAQVAPLARAAAADAVHDAGDRTAAEWFDVGVELEAVAPAEARAAYERAVQLDPDMGDARVNLGRLLHEAGLYEQSEAQYRHALTLREHALAAYNLGVLLEDRGRAAEAIQSYARALSADPQLAEAHFNLARLYEKRGDRKAALRHFNGYRALTRTP
jgi:tetratricopeptide (TPR) repeat protein